MQSDSAPLLRQQGSFISLQDSLYSTSDGGSFCDTSSTAPVSRHRRLFRGIRFGSSGERLLSPLGASTKSLTDRRSECNDSFGLPSFVDPEKLHAPFWGSSNSIDNDLAALTGELEIPPAQKRYSAPGSTAGRLRPTSNNLQKLQLSVFDTEPAPDAERELTSRTETPRTKFDEALIRLAKCSDHESLTSSAQTGETPKPMQTSKDDEFDPVKPVDAQRRETTTLKSEVPEPQEDRDDCEASLFADLEALSNVIRRPGRSRLASVTSPEMQATTKFDRLSPSPLPSPVPSPASPEQKPLPPDPPQRVSARSSSSTLVELSASPTVIHRPRSRPRRSPRRSYDRMAHNDIYNTLPGQPPPILPRLVPPSSPDPRSSTSNDPRDAAAAGSPRDDEKMLIEPDHFGPRSNSLNAPPISPFELPSEESNTRAERGPAAGSGLEVSVESS